MVATVEIVFRALERIWQHPNLLRPTISKSRLFVLNDCDTFKPATTYSLQSVYIILLTMAPLKSILRSGSWLLGRTSGSKQPEPTTSFELYEDVSVKKLLPPRLRSHHSESHSPSPDQPDATKETRVDQEAHTLRGENRVSEANDEDDEDDDVDTKISKEVDAFHMIESFISMLSSFGNEDAGEDFSVKMIKEEEGEEVEVDKAEEEEGKTVQGDGLEITLHHFVEYEKIRKERLKGGDGSQEATCGESLASEEKFTGGPRDRKYATTTRRTTPSQHIVEFKDIQKREIEKMKEKVEEIKQAMTERQLQHVLVGRTIEERMQKNFKILEESNKAQAKIEAEYERIMRKRGRNAPKTVLFANSSEEDNLLVPPPVECGLKVETYPEYEVHFADVQVAPDCYDVEDELFEFVDEELLAERDVIRRENMLNDWSLKVTESTTQAWGNILDFVEDVVLFARGGYCETDCRCDDLYENDSNDDVVAPVSEVMVPEHSFRKSFAE